MLILRLLGFSSLAASRIIAPVKQHRSTRVVSTQEVPHVTRVKPRTVKAGTVTIILDGQTVASVTDPALQSPASLGVILKAVGLAIEELTLSRGAS